MFLGFCCWLTPIPLTVLCVSTCSDGLLDFHREPFENCGSSCAISKIPEKYTLFFLALPAQY